MTKQEIREGNNVIGLFMDASFWGTKLSYWNELNKIPPMKYHESWDWQIPAYSKFAKQLKEFAAKDEDAHERYKRMINRYENHVFNNDPEQGFEELVFNIKWYNSNYQINHPQSQTKRSSRPNPNLTSERN